MAKITWAGQACFQISLSSSKDVQANVVIDPFDGIGIKMPNFDADILLVSHDHPDHNNIKAVKPARSATGAAGGTEPFLIDSPGEYEVKGVFIQGITSFHDDQEGKERGLNTIFTIEAEGMRLCHLGDFGQKQLTDEQLEKIGAVDILMIPVGGTYTIDANQATKVIGQIDPKIVIPMHYAIDGLKLPLARVDEFLKAIGGKSSEPQDKLVIKASALPKESDMQIVVLQP